MTYEIKIPNEITALADRGATFVVNHSGGKDSQAMLIKIRELVPADRILVVHAELPGADWPGTAEKVVETSEGLEVVMVKAGKTFMEMVERRGMFPSPKYRQCTSDLKRGPIEKAIRAHVKKTGNNLVVNCVGIRAEESSARSKAEPFKFNARNSKAGREWYDWLPIFDMLIGEVFGTIEAAGEVPHWAYQAGMSRLSCSFCIMASRADLTKAAELRPELYREYVEMENRIGHTMMMPRKGQAPEGLEAITGISIEIGTRGPAPEPPPALVENMELCFA